MYVDVWWIWPVALFVFTFVIGVISPLSGVGGGVLFVPIATAFFPFDIDFIRGVGLVMALTSSLSSTPQLIKRGLANLRIAAPIVAVSCVMSIIGSITGLWISGEFPEGKDYITILLGIVLFIIFGIMATSKRVEIPIVEKQDKISQKLGISGSFYEPTLGQDVEYKIKNMPVAIPIFAAVGFIAGMFGLGAGWANVPALNLVMGAPIKVATSTSMLVIAINDAAAVWVYLANGAILSVIAVPSVLGITLGARVGAKLAARARPKIIRYLVMCIMLLSAVVDIWKGLQGLGYIGGG
ncbi:sulfite exporter TauE/SafE family protein [Archaeoglobus neptunius]|uniref:sulfite exporter TauE/SafE family protein n=1 Tax=Archaeoglobus neptunius TaxID=2798580 RepID=UPI001925E630|nr:sulfite exporter TauE/SafE family protein [Archaeoglobus neptunius]